MPAHPTGGATQSCFGSSCDQELVPDSTRAAAGIATIEVMTRISGRDLVEIRSKMPAEIYDASMEMYKAIWRHGRLDTRLRELLRLKSASLAGCVH